MVCTEFNFSEKHKTQFLSIFLFFSSNKNFRFQKYRVQHYRKNHIICSSSLWIRVCFRKFVYQLNLMNWIKNSRKYQHTVLKFSVVVGYNGLFLAFSSDKILPNKWAIPSSRSWQRMDACAVSRQVRGLEGVDDRGSGLPTPRGEQASDRPGWRVAVLVTFATRVYPRINERCAWWERGGSRYELW